MLSVCFNKLSNEKGFKAQEQIKNSEKYFAHTPPDNGSRDLESLVRHMDQVRNTFLKLVELHGLDDIVDRHIEKIITNENFKNKENVYQFIKLLFFESIHFHDLGKLNENFQIEKMGLTEHFKSQKHSIGSNHSILSVFLFYGFMFEKVRFFESDEEQGMALVLILLFSMPIRKHHASELTTPFYYFENSNNENKNKFFENVRLSDLSKYLKILNIEYNKMFHKDLFEGDLSSNLNENYKKWFHSKVLEKTDSFSLYSLIKLNSSLLTISDYIATSRYMWNKDLGISGVIDKDLRENIYKSFYSSEDYNKKLKTTTPIDFEDLNKISEENLNYLRFKMAYEVKESLLNNINKNLFFLEAPTGGGKTNMSFMAVAELLKKREKLNRVFYVFPFTTLITQTQESIVKTFNLKSEDYIELHSKAGFQESDKDGEFGDKKKNFIDYQFVNYPITLLTHIKFFDIIKSHHKKDNYLYHKLSNSIVIIDELQAYPPEHWDKIYYFLKNISEIFNTVFIVMSATLPNIDKLNISGRVNFSTFIHLNKNKEKYFQNVNFAKRVEFDLSMIPENGNNTLSEIKKKVFDESKNYAEKHNGRSWTLIEFIFKKSASDFFDLISKDDNFSEYEIKMLSGTILEPVRKKIINNLKDRKDEISKIILVSTQVVEAGVDLDFDLGFKDTSIIDSDEQLAGRINRNASKTGCKVFLFNYNDEYHVYGSDYRYKIQKQKIDKAKYKEILDSKKFSDLYNPTFKFMEELNRSESRYGFYDYESIIRKLNYSAVNSEFKLIDQDTLSVFVNIEFDLEEYPIENTLGLEKNRKLSGVDVFNKYCSIVENKDQDYIDKKISLKQIQSLMSNFIFSTFKSKKIINNLSYFAEEKYGFWYIDNLKNSSSKEIFTLGEGLNEKALGDVQFI